MINPTDNFYDRNVERSLYIEEFLYTKSRCLLRINKISEFFEGVKNVNIQCQAPQPIAIDPPILIRPKLPILPEPPILLTPEFAVAKATTIAAVGAAQAV